MPEKVRTHVAKVKSREAAQTEPMLKNILGNVKTERILEYALVSIIGAWIGFGVWAEARSYYAAHPDLPSNPQNTRIISGN